jgi:mRNA interferase MazF
VVEEERILTRGGIYLAKLDPSKAAEVGKIRPVVILTAQALLDLEPPVVFICPLSSHSHPEADSLHIELLPRDNLHARSYALTEHCRSITIRRIFYPRIAQLTATEATFITHKLQKIIGL